MILKISELDDLIERNSSLDEKYINRELTDKTILITGAGGSIGSEITIQIAKSIPKELILIDHSEYNLYEINKKINNFAINQGKKIKIRRELVSITNQEKINKIFEQTHPDIVFHAAAYKHVHLLKKIFAKQ